ncbi:MULTISPECIES: hypothetical protein [unclassified Bacillus (in: firmicutes)]|uniref:hypothetical protein n=1 Tax=unclassified Bacillus (in: firmicutes) TaxID=185979 RepID=UPI0008E26B3C|nr:MULTISPECIES: hypothetical protein [unclassified Bacillus (in: firmicutes)]SFA81186.1 hypothetical protein SAMN02799634_1011008 [Bacillus sp. UNCCL13]SFQ71303.1 hypothetical protein SAMN04488577_1282 [Bacillus sp. cl95]
MNITTIIELKNDEVEEMAGAKLVFAKEQMDDHIVETCVECFKYTSDGQCIETEVAMEKVFNHLQEKGIIPLHIKDFSFEMPSCEKVKKNSDMEDIPQNVILSFMY